jgi:hypothetical protein
LNDKLLMNGELPGTDPAARTLVDARVQFRRMKWSRP